MIDKNLPGLESKKDFKAKGFNTPVAEGLAALERGRTHEAKLLPPRLRLLACGQRRGPVPALRPLRSNDLMSACFPEGSTRADQTTRVALAEEQARCIAVGQVMLKLKTPWRDGATRLVMPPPA